MTKLINGIIYTMNALQPKAEALAFENGVISAVGSNEEILHSKLGSNEIIDLQGATVIPGLIDAHIHLLQYGQKIEMVDCETLTKEECLQRVEERVKITPPGGWIIGQGWNHNIWEDGIGSKDELDRISTQHPIYLASKSLHSSWLNSKALQIAGIDSHTTPSPGGEIVKDSSGTPSGILLESASLLIEEKLPRPDAVTIRNTISAAQKKLNGFGITGIHDVDTWDIFPILSEMNNTRSLQLRVSKSIPRSAFSHVTNLGLESGQGDSYLKIGWLKLFMDGALGPQTAAMLEPYENDEKAFGMLTLSNEELLEIGLAARAKMISLEVHAIGDKANREVLHTLSKIVQNSHRTKLSLPHRIEHVQIIHPDDLQRMTNLSVVASMQPIHVISDMDTADKYWGERCRYSYAWNMIQQAGIEIVFGSDAPVESPNPFLGLFAAVYRKKKPSSKPWYPELAVDVQSALQAYTVNPARISGYQNEIGSLETNKFADLLILERDPFTCSPEQLMSLLPSATLINGQVVHTTGTFFH